MTLKEWHEAKRLWDAEVAAGLKKGRFTIPKPEKDPEVRSFRPYKGKHYKKGGKISKYYKAGGNVITGR